MATIESKKTETMEDSAAAEGGAAAVVRGFGGLGFRVNMGLQSLRSKLE